MNCSFFGHRKITDSVSRILEKEIVAVLEYYKSDIIFYVGDKGQFDRLVQLTLKKLEKAYPEIKVNIVLDSMPVKYENYFGFPTVLPDGIEKVPKRFAMSYRNLWMIEKCDLAIVCLTDTASNTRKHVDLLKRKKKTVINIADMLPFCLDNKDFIC